MRESAASRKYKVDQYIGMIVIAMITIFVLYFFYQKSTDVSKKLAFYENRAQALEQAIENEKQRTVEIEELKKYMQTDAYVEEVARNQFHYVKDNEIMFEEVQ